MPNPIKILTWNYGKHEESKLECILTHLFDNKEADPSTIYVMGLQEINDALLKTISAGITVADTHEIHIGISESRFNGFNLLTFVIWPLSLPKPTINFYKHHVESTPSNTIGKKNTITRRAKAAITNWGKTKGYLSAEITNGDKTMVFVNIHLPFKDEAFTKKNIEDLFEHYNDKTNIVIFGDFNTRSKYNDDCKNNQICQVEFTKNADVNKLTNLQQDLNTCESNRSECPDLIKDLVDTDYVTSSKIFTKPSHGYTEADIHFLPSYKILDDKYSLIKNGHGRLVGYADRIIYKGDFQLSPGPNPYKLVHCIGNDHFPIMLSLSTSLWDQAGGKRRRISRRRQSSRTCQTRKIYRKK